MATPTVSKLIAARKVGLRAPIAGAAAGLLALLILAAVLATGGRGGQVLDGGRRLLAGMDDLAERAQGLARGQFADLGFRVGAVRLQGASQSSRDEILQAAAIKPGEPILGLDLDAARARVERVGWVEHARVIRLLPQTLVISVDERPIVAVWQHHGRRDVVTADGHVVGAVDPSGFAGLPLLVGDGANSQAAALLPQLQNRPRLGAHLWAIRRVDGRRWDLVLKDGAVVMLPDTDEASALDRLDRLDQGAHVLDLGLARIDLRDADFTVVRTRGPAPTTTTTSHGA